MLCVEGQTCSRLRVKRRKRAAVGPKPDDNGMLVTAPADGSGRFPVISQTELKHAEYVITKVK